MSKVSFYLNAPESKKLFKPLFMVVNHSTVLQILESILVIKNGTLSFTSTDLENIVRIEVDAPKCDDFSFCLNSDYLRKFIENAIDEKIDFIPAKGKIAISCGGVKLNTNTEDIGGFPKTGDEMFRFDKKATVNAKELNKLFSNAFPFMSNDDLRPALTGLNLIDWNGELFTATTDGHRLFYKALMKTPETLKGVNIIIPKKSIRIFIETFKKGDVEISIGVNHIKFQAESKTIITRLIDARYPKFDAVIPKNDFNFSMQRKQLLSFLKLAKPFVNLVTYHLIVKITETGIDIIGGDFDFDTEINYKAPIYNPSKQIIPFEFAINLRFWEQALRLNNDEYTVINSAMNGTKAMIIDDVLLLMPLLLNK